MSDDPQPVLSPPASNGPRLLTELEPWHQVFRRNLNDLFRDLFRKPTPFPTTTRPAPFWSDVFVSFPLPRRGLAQSALFHTFALVALYGLNTAWVAPPLTQASAFRNTHITYYSVSEYLPPLDSGSEPAPQARKGEPAYARQKVISLPKSPDNSRQTIIDPSTARILRDPKRMPNLVAWTPIPSPVPISGATRSASQITLPKTDMSVIAPAVQDVKRDVAQMKVSATRPDVIEAPVQDAKRDMSKLNLPAAPGAVEPSASADAVKRNLGEMNIGQMQATVADPHLPVAEQRSLGAGAAGGSAANANGTRNVASDTPPAPSGAGIGAVGPGAGRLIALGLDAVAATGPIEMPGGNRRGVFAAGPEGKPGAPGTPDLAGGGKGPGGRGTGDAGAGKGGASDVPGGIMIAGGPGNSGGMVAGTPVAASPAPAPTPPPVKPKPAPATPNLFAATVPTRVSDIARQTGPSHPEAKLEDEVFGAKRYYTMALNMPNLTSSDGSWIIRFAELNANGPKGDLTAPVATQKVDPAYPADMIRENVEGTVTIYAIIRADGSVAEAKVLRGVNDRLDANACTAFLRWHFRPATKNGSAVDLEAVVMIPFRTRKPAF